MNWYTVLSVWKGQKSASAIISERRNKRFISLRARYQHTPYTEFCIITATSSFAWHRVFQPYLLLDLVPSDSGQCQFWCFLNTYFAAVIISPCYPARNASLNGFSFTRWNLRARMAGGVHYLTALLPFCRAGRPPLSAAAFINPSAIFPVFGRTSIQALRTRCISRNRIDHLNDALQPIHLGWMEKL